jgi:putative flippase GtrA
MRNLVESNQRVVVRRKRRRTAGNYVINSIISFMENLSTKRNKMVVRFLYNSILSLVSFISLYELSKSNVNPVTNPTVGGAFIVILSLVILCRSLIISMNLMKSL